jgi:hypothetical protein
MQRSLPQGLKPDASNAVMSELKLRPPKNMFFFAACEVCATETGELFLGEEEEVGLAGGAGVDHRGEVAGEVVGVAAG